MTEDMINMSPSYRGYTVTDVDDVTCSFFFKTPEIEKMFLWPDINRRYDMNIRVCEEDAFVPPEIFVQQAKEKLNPSEGVENFGFGSILLKNNMKYLYGIFYSEDSSKEFRDKIYSFASVFGTNVFEARKDGTLKLVHKTERDFR